MKSLQEHELALLLLANALHSVHVNQQTLALTVASMIVKDGKEFSFFQQLERDMKKTSEMLDEINKKLVGS